MLRNLTVPDSAVIARSEAALAALKAANPEWLISALMELGQGSADLVVRHMSVVSLCVPAAFCGPFFAPLSRRRPRSFVLRAQGTGYHRE